jgi:hypothetical protein
LAVDFVSDQEPAELGNGDQYHLLFGNNPDRPLRTRQKFLAEVLEVSRPGCLFGYLGFGSRCGGSCVCIWHYSSCWYFVINLVKILGVCSWLGQ